MPLIAVIDTATPAVTAAVAEVTAAGTVVLAERTTVDARAHGELLAPQLAAALAEAGAVPGDLAAVVAGTGPGPFTGLRVGLVTAAALADTLGVPAYGVCSLDALGLGAAGVTLAATDARRKEIYWAVYAGGARRAGPAVGRPGDVADLLGGLGVVRAVGEGARRYAGVLGLPVDGPDHPPPAALAALAADRVRAGAPPEPLTPLYLRRPDAVEPAGRKRVLA
ncbi:MAG TPA: tRNA (adenosine(37)-N6)-threonylcarbamoyltransferase complex dimerization subunit type 1 TsaB [Micromonosporaceae bacterium]|nr:tRNA (adenosine(37)-N6)-threonylcarbamoyltransferase complex dimerization subunit type 1 TsaB [Micromonosporaceae bacterium]